MIIARSPLRITLGGGGTDLPSYYSEYGGFVISAAIDKYVYATVMRPFQPGIYLKYSQMEHVQLISEVRHPIIREALVVAGMETQQIEITTLADIPAGTGLGSSGSFTTALLKALYAHRKHYIHPLELAEQACHIEIERLAEPVGKQDQYIAALGGLTCFEFKRQGQVLATPLDISESTLNELEDRLLLFFTGFSRRAGSILSDQLERTTQQDTEILENLHFTKELGLRSKVALEAGDPLLFGKLMSEHWQHKKKRFGGMSNLQIDAWYELGCANGAIGGKLVGAGGGGFLMFYAEDTLRLRLAMQGAGLEEVRFRFDFEGTKIVLS
jgi:D-glycero-alpha-D-manno-heptose-7-phosphate kinase